MGNVIVGAVQLVLIILCLIVAYTIDYIILMLVNILTGPLINSLSNNLLLLPFKALVQVINFLTDPDFAGKIIAAIAAIIEVAATNGMLNKKMI
jgi:hypothetical protein